MDMATSSRSRASAPRHRLLNILSQSLRCVGLLIYGIIAMIAYVVSHLAPLMLSLTIAVSPLLRVSNLYSVFRISAWKSDFIAVSDMGTSSYQYVNMRDGMPIMITIDLLFLLASLSWPACVIGCQLSDIRDFISEIMYRNHLAIGTQTAWGGAPLRGNLLASVKGIVRAFSDYQNIARRPRTERLVVAGSRYRGDAHLFGRNPPVIGLALMADMLPVIALCLSISSIGSMAVYARRHLIDLVLAFLHGERDAVNFCLGMHIQEGSDQTNGISFPVDTDYVIVDIEMDDQHGTHNGRVSLDETSDECDTLPISSEQPRTTLSRLPPPTQDQSEIYRVMESSV